MGADHLHTAPGHATPSAARSRTGDAPTPAAAYAGLARAIGNAAFSRQVAGTLQRTLKDGRLVERQRGMRLLPFLDDNGIPLLPAYTPQELQALQQLHDECQTLDDRLDQLEKGEIPKDKEKRVRKAVPGKLVETHDALLTRARGLAEQLKARPLVQRPAAVRIVGVELELLIPSASPNFDSIRVFFSLQRHAKWHMLGYDAPDVAKTDVQDLNTVIYCSEQEAQQSFLAYGVALADAINAAGAQGRTVDATTLVAGQPLQFKADEAKRVPLNRVVHTHPVTTPGYALTLNRELFTDLSRVFHAWSLQAETPASAKNRLKSWLAIRDRREIQELLSKSEWWEIDTQLQSQAARFEKKVPVS